jgi:glycosyltransferase involved in cell wall biosynthesis
MHELVENRGWLIPPIREGKAVSKYFTPLDATQCIANEEKAADALEDAYQHPEKRQKFAELGRAHALQFDWTKVNPLWIELFEEIRQSMTTKPLLERQL